MDCIVRRINGKIVKQEVTQYERNLFELFNNQLGEKVLKDMRQRYAKLKAKNSDDLWLLQGKRELVEFIDDNLNMFRSQIVED